MSSVMGVSFRKECLVHGKSADPEMLKWRFKFFWTISEYGTQIEPSGTRDLDYYHVGYLECMKQILFLKISTTT